MRLYLDCSCRRWLWTLVVRLYTIWVMFLRRWRVRSVLEHLILDPDSRDLRAIFCCWQPRYAGYISMVFSLWENTPWRIWDSRLFIFWMKYFCTATGTDGLSTCCPVSFFLLLYIFGTILGGIFVFCFWGRRVLRLTWFKLFIFISYIISIILLCASSTLSARSLSSVSSNFIRSISNGCLSLYLQLAWRRCLRGFTFRNWFLTFFWVRCTNCSSLSLTILSSISIYCFCISIFPFILP